MTRIDEIVDGIYRISTPPVETPITFNQFLIDDERPALIHTGVHPAYDDIRKAITEVLDPARLELVILLHFEGDECGGMERFVAEAPAARLVGCDMSAILNLNGFGFPYMDRVTGVRDGDTIELGRHTLRFLETPHVHHWDSMMVVEESTHSLFPSDLFIQPGDQPPVVDEDLGSEMCAFYRELGIFAHEDPVRRVVDRIEQERPDWVHAMHGGTLTGDVLPRYTRALREQRFGFEGKLLGRELPSAEPTPAA
jgi:flavorubredoxin